MTDKFFIDTSLLDEFYVRYSSGRFGVADVFILKPSSPDDAPRCARCWKASSFQGLRSLKTTMSTIPHQIAQDAQIFEQGGYIIMLTLADTGGRALDYRSVYTAHLTTARRKEQSHVQTNPAGRVVLLTRCAACA